MLPRVRARAKLCGIHDFVLTNPSVLDFTDVGVSSRVWRTRPGPTGQVKAEMVKAAHILNPTLVDARSALAEAIDTLSCTLERTPLE